MSDHAVDLVCAELTRRIGMKPSATLRRRLGRYLADGAALESVPVLDYSKRILGDERRVQTLIDEATVQESSFFRDDAQFAALADQILPCLDRPVRIWSAGCGVGQEPYSLAMLLLEAGHREAEVLATDVSTAALATARQGRYRESELRGLTPQRRATWMVREGDRWRVGPQVRRMVRFAKHNLASEDPPFEPNTFPVVFCRNVMIYFDRATILSALDRIYRGLPEGGTVFLGYSETLSQITDLFDVVKLNGAFAYRKPGHQSTAPREPRPLRTVKAGHGLRSPAVKPLAQSATAPQATTEPSPTSLIGSGERAMRDQQPAVAAGAFRQAAFLDQTNPVAHFLLGVALDENGEINGASRAYRAALTALRRLSPQQTRNLVAGYDSATLRRHIESKLSSRR